MAAKVRNEFCQALTGAATLTFAAREERQPPVDMTAPRLLSRRPARQPPRPRLLGCQSLKEPSRYADPHWRSGGGRGGLLLIAPPK
jgi:hypothetical protein